METAVISDIKRFAVHDGPGIRTTVFLKGCSLKCVWCHNPESIPFRPQLASYPDRCISCGSCAEVCPTGAHRIGTDGHQFHRELCSGCGACQDVCLGNALHFYGKTVTVAQLLPNLLEDRNFYLPNGGVTLSGGECLCQADFCMELLKALKEETIHTAVDTCGFVPQAALDKVVPYTDLFLYDIKAMDESVHKRCTGQSNRLILENLRHLDDLGKSTEIRIPFVPGYNSDQIPKIRDFVRTLHHVTQVKVLPYHQYAASKYTALGMENTLPQMIPTEEEIRAAENCLQNCI